MVTDFVRDAAATAAIFGTAGLTAVALAAIPVARSQSVAVSAVTGLAAGSSFSPRLVSFGAALTLA